MCASPHRTGNRRKFLSYDSQQGAFSGNLLLVLGGSDRYDFDYSYRQFAISRRMAVIHISRTEAANDFDGLIARAGKGDGILIESNACVVARLLPGDAPRPRLLSESLRILKDVLLP